ncbi:MAG: DUF5010 C-terminal domain-containing protein [Reichenbachiella sp.]
MLNTIKWIVVILAISILTHCAKNLNSLSNESSSALSDESARLYSLQELTDLRDTKFPPKIDQGSEVTVIITEDTQLSLPLSVTDVDSDLLVWSIVVSPSSGIAEASGVGELGNVLYTPVAHYVGDVTFAIEVDDGELTDTIQITVTVESENDFPVYVGEAVLSGVFSHEEAVGLEPGGTCSDPYDAMNSVHYRYAWYRDADIETKYDGHIIESASVYSITVDDMDGYLYGVVSCVDDEGGVTSDTTEYSPLIKYRRAVKVQASLGGSVDDEGEHFIFEGVELNVKAVPMAGYQFIQWVQSSGAGMVQWGDSLAGSTVLQVLNGPVTVTAQFDVDATHPSIPQKLTTIGNHDGVIELEWQASTDNVGVVAYRIYNDDVLVEEVVQNKTFIGGLAFNKITVSAIDAAGLESTQSAPLYHIEVESRSSSVDITYSAKDSVGYAGSLDDDYGGYKDNATWIEKTLSAGTYQLKMRISDNDGTYETGIQLYVDGKYQTAIRHHGSTGGWHSWECYYDDNTFSVVDGTYAVRLEYWGGNWNVDWLEFIPQ